MRRRRFIGTAAAVDVDGWGSSADVAGVVGTSVVDGTLTRTPLFVYCEYDDSSIVGIRSVGVFLVDGGHMPTKVAGVLNPSLALRTIIRSLCRRQTSRCFPGSVFRPCHVDRRSEYNETAAVYIGIRSRTTCCPPSPRARSVYARNYLARILDAANSLQASFTTILPSLILRRHSTPTSAQKILQILILTRRRVVGLSPTIHNSILTLLVGVMKRRCQFNFQNVLKTTISLIRRQSLG